MSLESAMKNNLKKFMELLIILGKFLCLALGAISMAALLSGCDKSAKHQSDEPWVGLSATLLVATILLSVLLVKNRTAHRRARLLLDATPLACRLLNRTLRIFECNEETVRLFHLKDKQEYVDRYYDLFPEYQPDGQSSREKIQAALENAFAEGRYIFEFMYHLPDGTPLPCEDTLVRVEYGNDYVVAGYTRDLREQKRMMTDVGLRNTEKEKLLLERQRETYLQPEEPMYTVDELRAGSPRRSGIDRRSLGLGINGLNMDKGIERFGGNEDVYFEVLRSYATNTPQLLHSIQSVNINNLDDYAIVIRGIKGSSRGLCADEFADIAERLEKAANNGDYKFIEIHNDSFLRSAWVLLKGVDDVLANVYDESMKPRKDRPDPGLLDKILKACETYDMETVDASIAELECYEYDSGGEIVSWLFENVQHFNISEIKNKLSALIGEKEN